MTQLAKNDAIVLSATDAVRQMFWGKVDKTGDCWLWQGPLTSFGHGRYWIRRTVVSAHRIAKLWETGEPRLEMLACHLCASKNCVRPSHIYWGTQADNVRDAVAAGNLLHGKTRGEMHYRATVSNTVAADIWMALVESPDDMRSIAERFETELDTVRSIKYGMSYTSVTDKLPRILARKKADEYPKFIRKKRQAFTAAQAEQICKMLDEGVRLGDLATFAETCAHTIHNIYYELRGCRPKLRPSKKRSRKMRSPKFKN